MPNRPLPPQVFYAKIFDDRKQKDRAEQVSGPGVCNEDRDAGGGGGGGYGGGGGSAGKERGLAQRWNGEKGFGFIKPEDGGEDLFCHVSSIEDGNALREGDTVFYKKVFDERKQKDRAEQVSGGIREGDGGRGGGGGYGGGGYGGGGYGGGGGGGGGDRYGGGGGACQAPQGERGVGGWWQGFWRCKLADLTHSNCCSPQATAVATAGLLLTAVATVEAAMAAIGAVAEVATVVEAATAAATAVAAAVATTVEVCAYPSFCAP